MTPAETLRAAADRLDELAGATMTASRWHFDPSDSAVKIPSADRSGYRIVAPGLDDGEKWDWLVADNQWIAALGPQVAAPLSAWLRYEGDELALEQQDSTQDCHECRGTGQVYDGDPLPFPCSDCVVTPCESAQHALDFARTVLGETAPSPTN